MSEIRVRFAPSPTGPLHIGGVRTALYNFLFAKKNNGKMILRIEDTDQTRFVSGAEEYIIESLSWCGIEFDEGVHCGGTYSPYRQSERKDIYRKYADLLVENRCAYYAFDTPEELENLRKETESKKEIFVYNQVTRKKLKNSLTLSADETKKLISEGIPYVIRALIPENEKVVVNDLIRGEVVVNTTTLDDKVLFKSDGMPTYHLANVIDDYIMKISHVIRGEEWLPSAPLHVLLYRFFGWEDSMPIFAHLPLLLKPDGNGKLSKRDGDRLGFPVFPLNWEDPSSGEISSGYREAGYIPEAFINMLALLGWNPGTEKEIFTIQELIESFSLDRVSKAGAKFDPEKAKWFNHQYFIKIDNKAIAEMLIPVLKEKGLNIDFDYTIKVCELVKDRVNFSNELWDHTDFFYVAPDKYDEHIIKKRWSEEIPEILKSISAEIENTLYYDHENLEKAIKSYILNNKLNMGQIMNCLRLAIVGKATGPDLISIIQLIGKGETLSRIKKAIEVIK